MEELPLLKYAYNCYASGMGMSMEEKSGLELINVQQQGIGFLLLEEAFGLINWVALNKL